MVANTDELILEKSLQQRLRASQQTLIEAIRQRDKARLEVQRLTLALRDLNDCLDHTQAALLERLREITSPEPIKKSEVLQVAIDVQNWPANWHFRRMFDVEMTADDGELIQIQFWLREATDDTVTYEVCRLY